MLGIFIKERNQNKTIQEVLNKVPGVGKSKVNFICKEIGLFSLMRWDDLTDKQINHLAFWIENNFIGSHVVGFDFSKKRKDHLVFLKNLGHYRGIRLAKGLPCRGQNTHSNAKTAKRVR